MRIMPLSDSPTDAVLGKGNTSKELPQTEIAHASQDLNGNLQFDHHIVKIRAAGTGSTQVTEICEAVEGLEPHSLAATLVDKVLPSKFSSRISEAALEK